MKKQNGITLIALVITIIVLLILAGIALTSINGENGILSNASKAKEKTDIGGDKEKIALALSEYSMEQKSSIKIEEYLRSKSNLFSDVSVFNNIITIKMKDCGHIYSINADGAINKEETDGKELVDDTQNDSLKSMLSTWRVEAGQTIELPILKAEEEYNNGWINYNYNFVVDWGDGSVVESFNSADDASQMSVLKNYNNEKPEIITVAWAPDFEYAATHTYTTSGVYQIKITGSFDLWHDENRDNPELLSIDQWGVTNTKEYRVFYVTESIASPSKNSFKNCNFVIGSEEKIFIPRNAFCGVENLVINWLNADEIMIPESVKSVEFYSDNLKNIRVEENNSVYTSIDGILYSKDKSTLLRFPRSTNRGICFTRFC